MNFQDQRESDQNEKVHFNELLTKTIDEIAKKSSHVKERTQSVPKLKFDKIEEFKKQNWLGYSQKLQDSIKILN